MTNYVGICPICFEPVEEVETISILDDGNKYHRKCVEEKPDSHYLQIEKIYSQLWQYSELWVEFDNSSNYVEGIKDKQELLRYIMKRDLIKSFRLTNGIAGKGASNVRFTLESQDAFNKVNMFCNTRDTKYLI